MNKIGGNGGNGRKNPARRRPPGGTGLNRNRLRQLYRRLYRAYGSQSWWPADSPFEVMVGAVLTQGTSWKNAERAIAKLRETDCLRPRKLLSLPHDELAARLRACGYFRVKAHRLQNLCRWLLGKRGCRALQRIPTDELRASLLSVNGIGPETADDILLYACGRPVFVVDAYTRRLFSRLGWARQKERYDILRLRVEESLQADAAFYNEFHALIVRHSKEKCSGRKDCRHCIAERGKVGNEAVRRGGQRKTART
ncbi:MAG: endonuclease [Gammaproteobacteria bacterium]|nr:endonuclease [Gammaproteobacteria bacterium]